MNSNRVEPGISPSRMASPALRALGALVLLLSAGILWPEPRPASATGNVITSPDTAGDVGEWASVKLDATGYPVVSYYDSTNEDLKILHCNDANCAGGDDSISSPDSIGWVGVTISLALDASGFPVVAYLDPPTAT